MVSTHHPKNKIKQRLQTIVSNLIKEQAVLQENVNTLDMVELLYNLVKDNLTNEQFYQLSDEQLKKYCSRVISTEMISKISEDLTPEQVAIFETAIQRK